MRESPSIALIRALRDKGAIVFWNDDLVQEWNGEKSVALSSGYDLAIIATIHKDLELNKLGSTLILDTRR
jgi:UDP-N-acetyl-D-mannosaminuronate dehydrogenase